MSDRIIVMREGQIEQADIPLAIYDRPRTAFVADFIGAANLVAGNLHQDTLGATILDCGGIALLCAATDPLPQAGEGGQHTVAIRTVYPQLGHPGRDDRANTWDATLLRRTLLGDIVSYVVRWPAGELRVHTFPSELFNEGDPVRLHIPPARAVPLEG